MQPITYNENPLQHSFQSFVKQFGQLADNEILLDPATGTGNIRFFDIEPGLQLRLWNCSFNNGLSILRTAQTNTESRTFTVVCYLTPESFILEDHHNKPSVVNEIWNTVLMSSDADFKVTLLPGKSFQCVSMNFSADWLQKNVLCDITQHTHLLHRFAMAADPFAIFESLSNMERALAIGFFEKGSQCSFGKFFLRSKTLNLLTSFFSKLVTRMTGTQGYATFHDEQMVEVEKELSGNLYNGLPNLKILARKICVSESTLKRYFSRIYGKSIYSYYLAKRMECAKRLILEKKKTVSETASILGYESLSHFSSMFKKHFGLLPGDVHKDSVQTI